MVVERLQKYLANAGIGSRRACEKFIEEGLITLNGTVIRELGIKIDTEKDKVLYKKAPIPQQQKKMYFKMYKPKDYITTASDPKQRKTVYELLPNNLPVRVYPVGRLDRNTSGLLFFTNDGELANNLMHPSKKISKTYRVTIDSKITKKAVEKLGSGIMLEDGMTLPAQVEVELIQSDKTIFLLTIYEGRNRQVRRMCESLGLNITALKRLTFGTLMLENMTPGKVKELSLNEIKMLRSLAKKS
ncbi:MAG: hypothetical protein A2X42_12190 [Candidatus Margulisbacteria bacterium GWF2_38_17]|nr:MAG: hypothetical protein A2X43_05550 [Candidatus Margulisbacteria bacterium GWD2_39_127]OGI01020.1 MAG: hypothetical protein A2X42_12190 [Candidatus Margulisbacteria bacterium GWF2_38_17]OGI09549.1 MAG: hypothetical protein A2X41_06395 [Candidatus Margulisbacteria bacterium GWE2_39_32]